MRHMQGACNLTVDSTWCDFVLDQFFFLSCRHSVKESLISEWFTIFHKTDLSHLMSQIIDILAFCFHAPLFSDAKQFLRIFYLIISALFCTVQCMADLTTMIGVSSCTTGCKFKEVSSYDTMSITSADSSWSLRCNTTRSHCTDTAADTLLTEFTVRSLVLCTDLPCICSYLCTCLEKTGCSGFKFLHCS